MNDNYSTEYMKNKYLAIFHSYVEQFKNENVNLFFHFKTVTVKSKTKHILVLQMASDYNKDDIKIFTFEVSLFQRSTNGDFALKNEKAIERCLMRELKMLKKNKFSQFHIIDYFQKLHLYIHYRSIYNDYFNRMPILIIIAIVLFLIFDVIISTYFYMKQTNILTN